MTTTYEGSGSSAGSSTGNYSTGSSSSYSGGSSISSSGSYDAKGLPYALPGGSDAYSRLSPVEMPEWMKPKGNKYMQQLPPIPRQSDYERDPVKLRLESIGSDIYKQKPRKQEDKEYEDIIPFYLNWEKLKLAA